MSRPNKQAFTLVELMLALAFFSFILMFVLGGFMLITRNYSQGVTSTRVHQAGRNVMEQVVRDLRSSSTDPIFYRHMPGGGPANQGVICYDGGIYRAWDRATNPANLGMFKHSDTRLGKEACSVVGEATFNASFNAGQVREVLNPDELVVLGLNLEEVAGSTNLYRLSLSIGTSNVLQTGADDLGADSDSDGFGDECNAAVSGSEYCRVVTLSTIFSARATTD